MRYASFADALQPLAARMPPIIREREILRVAATLGGNNGEKTADEARQEILKWVRKRSGSDLPNIAWQHQTFEHAVGGRNSAAVRISDKHRDVWAIRANDPDKNVAQRIWTIEAIVGYRPNQRALFSLRLLVGSPETELAADPAVPGLVRQIISACRLERGAVGLETEPWTIQTDDDAEALCDLLVDSTRDVPIFVLSVPNDAVNKFEPLLEPSLLARQVAGIAKVAVLPARLTWALTRRFEKQLAVYNGAVRVYRPGFDEDASLSEHQLFLAERLREPANAALVSTSLRRVAAAESLRRYRLGQDVLTFSAVREESLDLKRGRLEQAGAPDKEQLAAARSQIGAMKEDLAEALKVQHWFSDEHKTAEDRARAAEERLAAAGYRIRQLTDQLREHGGRPDENISLPTSWGNFADWCERNLVGRLSLSPRAMREVRAPEFRDVAVAARCLLWLANEYRERRLNGGAGDLRQQLESGIENERCGADSFPFDWQGSRFDVEWHVKSGGNKRDPSRCLRIYYFWDGASQQVVIASMPAHIRTGAS